MRAIARWFYVGLILVGISFYIGWGLFFQTWNLFDPEAAGVYAVLIVLVGFGIVGTLLYSMKED
jgi:CHASE2 domain-containing sensor protein